MCFHAEKKERISFEKWNNDTLYHLIVTIYNRIHNRLYISLLEKYVLWYRKQNIDVFVLPSKENVFPLKNIENVLKFVKKTPDFRDEKNIHFVFSLLFKNVPNVQDFKKDYKEFINTVIEQKEVGIKEVGTKDVGTKEVGIKEVGRKEVGTKEVGTKEVGTKEVGTKEVGRKEVGTKEVGTKEKVKKRYTKCFTIYSIYTVSVVTVSGIIYYLL